VSVACQSPVLNRTSLDTYLYYVHTLVLYSGSCSSSPTFHLMIVVPGEPAALGPNHLYVRLSSSARETWTHPPHLMTRLFW